MGWLKSKSGQTHSLKYAYHDLVNRFWNGPGQFIIH